MATPEAPLREILKSISFTRFPLRAIEPFFVADKLEKPKLLCYPPLLQAPTDLGSTVPKLPTFDLKSLYVLTALRFIGYDFDVGYTSEPDASPDKVLPFLLLCDGTVLTYKGIMGKLKGVPGSSTENRADDKNSSDGALDQLCLPESDLPSELVYRTMAERNFLPAVEYMSWADPVGRECIGEERYLGNYPTVIRYVLSWIKTSEATQNLKMAQPEHSAGASMLLDGETLYENAFRALDSLLVLFEDVGNTRIFLAGKPSLLDALVFSCISVVLDAPVDSPLRKALIQKNTYRPVLDYALQLRKKYFSQPANQLGSA
ncbi:Metaxin-2 [Coemansia sp. RSA 1813]|nr:Metaxin-2 [Coemansia sp. RSA 1646]KAJ1766624.1 Metaxin-2 [Coemansia sp. RSA 1843]KAJ2085667.1 Metaxin-2 [Coemansia sp. RSA 986]KAJ2210583.1 Metaxin-2 [Coemansia sp. RSA 487]KAJ2563126.1 Metaxin-2 [Coemansia sp. RSA 1813]